jgi:hypothetical protein
MDGCIGALADTKGQRNDERERGAERWCSATVSSPADKTETESDKGEFKALFYCVNCVPVFRIRRERERETK